MKSRSSKLKPLLVAPIALLLALAGVTATPRDASALVTGASLTQCNDPSVAGFSGAGREVICTVSITNTVTLDASGNLVTGSASGTRTVCIDFDGVACAGGNTTTTPIVNATQPITTVTQCNGVLAGGSTVRCSVTITSTIISPAAIGTTAATVNQCVGSMGGGGGPGNDPATGSALNCQPFGATSSASVTQCNGSANGGGIRAGSGCKVGSSPTNTTTDATTTAVMPLFVNQCNGSAAGAGDTLACTSGLTNTINLTTPTPTATATSVPATATATSVPATAVPGSPNNGYRAPDYHAELTPRAAAPAVVVPTVAGGSPSAAASVTTGISPELASLLRKVPEATVAGAAIPAVQTPAAQVPASLPRSGSGYGEIQRELLLASVGAGGLFAVSAWLRKRRKS